MPDRFYFSNGAQADSLESFKEVLKSLPENDFVNHVNEQKNDFANWIQYSLKMPDLASRVKMYLLKEDIENAVDEWLAKDFDSDSSAAVQPREEDDEKMDSILLSEPKLVDNPQKAEHDEEHVKSLSRDFLYGAILGFIFGLIVMALLVQAGLLF